MLTNLYYSLKPFLPRQLRSGLRRAWVRRVLRRSADLWPISPSAGRQPQDWPGWPEGRQFAFVLTHDIEGREGLDRVRPLVELELSLGFRSSFNFIPEGPYDVPLTLREWLTKRGFEVGVHDLYHDGKLYASRKKFRRHAQRINQYLREWNASGFRSGFMHHNLEWLHDLEITYDASTFDTDPFEPQPDGVGTIFPFWVPHCAARGGDFPAPTSPLRGYLELPYTLPQDSTLFFYVGEEDTRLWKRKLDWIAERGGMALLNVHPDYMGLTSGSARRWEYPVEYYRTFLRYVRDRYAAAAWMALPQDVVRYVSGAYGGGPRRPKHIGMLTYSFFERDNRVLRYAKTLAARGDLVDVLSLGGAGESNQAPPGPDAAPADITQSPESADGEGTTGAGPGLKALVSENGGIRIHHVQERRRDERQPLDFLLRVASFCWRSSRLLIRLQKLQQFDLVHVHNVPDFIVFAAWYPRRRGARIILDLHDLLPEFYQSRFRSSAGSPIYRFLLLCERWSCRFSDHVIVSNDLWRERVAARSVDPDRCTALVNHVDLGIFQARRPVSDFEHPIVIFPGGLQHHQGVHLAIQAFVAVAKLHAGAELHIVGDGPERENLVALAKQLKLNGQVRFFPPVPLHQVPLLLSGSHVGVVPKLAEGFGNEAYSTKIMEFMAAGLPVVAARTRIDQYYFGDGQVYFFEAGNAQDLSLALDRVLTDSELRRHLVQRGYEYVRHHSWERKSREYVALVDGLLAGAGAVCGTIPPAMPRLGPSNAS